MAWKDLPPEFADVFLFGFTIAIIIVVVSGIPRSLNIDIIQKDPQNPCIDFIEQSFGMKNRIFCGGTVFDDQNDSID